MFFEKFVAFFFRLEKLGARLIILSKNGSVFVPQVLGLVFLTISHDSALFFSPQMTTSLQRLVFWINLCYLRNLW